MNVTELAVLLDNTEFPICHEAAAMLRQQQAEMDIVIKLSHIESPLLLEFARAILLKAQEK